MAARKAGIFQRRILAATEGKGMESGDSGGRGEFYREFYRVLTAKYPPERYRDGYKMRIYAVQAAGLSSSRSARPETRCSMGLQVTRANSAQKEMGIYVNMNSGKVRV